MAKTDFTSVDAYIAAQPDANKTVLARVRGILRKAVPGADEVIAYQIPAYKVDGRAVIYFAGWKKHYSLYPLSDALIETFKDEIKGYEMSKGTLRFPLDEPIPAKLIERIAKFRAREEAAKEKTKKR